MVKPLKSCEKVVDGCPAEAPAGDHDGSCALDLGAGAGPTSRGATRVAAPPSPTIRSGPEI